MYENCVVRMNDVGINEKFEHMLKHLRKKPESNILFNSPHVRPGTCLKCFSDVFERALQRSGCQSEIRGEVVTSTHDRPPESTDDPNSGGANAYPVSWGSVVQIFLKM